MLGVATWFGVSASGVGIPGTYQTNMSGAGRSNGIFSTKPLVTLPLCIHHPLLIYPERPLKKSLNFSKSSGEMWTNLTPVR